MFEESSFFVSSVNSLQSEVDLVWSDWSDGEVSRWVTEGVYEVSLSDLFSMANSIFLASNCLDVPGFLVQLVVSNVDVDTEERSGFMGDVNWFTNIVGLVWTALLLNLCVTCTCTDLSLNFLSVASLSWCSSMVCKAERWK